MQTITFQEAIAIIDSGEPFSVEYVSYDFARKTGGKNKYLAEVVSNKKKTTKGKRSAYGVDKRKRFRTVFQCINGHRTNALKRFNIYLITKVNGKQVML